MKLNEDGKTVAAMDCLVPGIGEIIGGSQREDNYEKLRARMAELDMDLDEYGFYLDLRKFGSTRHAGYGLGLNGALCISPECPISVTVLTVPKNGQQL